MKEQDLVKGLEYITYGLYIVTSCSGNQDGGLIVNTVFQVTAAPARVAISVNKESFTHHLIKQSGIFAAMPLEQQTDLPFIGRFGFRTMRNFDKFAGLETWRGVLGAPIVKDHTLSFLEAQVEQTLDVDTHTLFIGRVKNAGEMAVHGQPLTYEYYHNVIKGKTPKGATHL